MTVDVVTKEDLQAFRLQLLGDIKRLMAQAGSNEPEPWLKNRDVRKLLNVSSNTVQRLRISGKLKPSKIGGVYYYRRQDIEKLLENGL